MIITFTFISILLIFIRIYSVFNLSFVHEDKSYFSYRITIFTLFFETFVIFFYSFFSSLKFLLPPILMVINTSKFEFNILENISLPMIIYFFVNFILIITFFIPSDIINIINRYFIIVIFLINIILGLTLLL